MYTRSYYGDEGGSGIRIPDGYDGTALLESEAQPVAAPVNFPPETQKREIKVSPKNENTEEAVEQTSAQDSGHREKSADKWQIPLLFKKIFPTSEIFSFSKIGSEELLIGAVALFLLFSKSGDKLCALMLLALIFID